MCQFCAEHGEGKKWYLQAANYSEDLLSDVRRRSFIRDFFAEPTELASSMKRVEHLQKLPPFVREMIGRLITRKMKPKHFGQVVPIDDLEKIFEFVNSVVRVGCICRYIEGKPEKRYCYGLSLAPDGGKMAEIMESVDVSYLNGPDNAGLEQLDKTEALAAIRRLETEGLCHTVWTFHTPFIGGVCNCDRVDCAAMRMTASHAIPVLFRGEYVASVDHALCTGCRECMRLCQFGAIGYGASTKTTSVDQRWCYGCGICRSACKQNAIHLTDRAQVPAAANLW